MYILGSSFSSQYMQKQSYGDIRYDDGCYWITSQGNLTNAFSHNETKPNESDQQHWLMLIANQLTCTPVFIHYCCVNANSQTPPANLYRSISSLQHISESRRASVCSMSIRYPLHTYTTIHTYIYLYTNVYYTLTREIYKHIHTCICKDDYIRRID